jgi:uncharacterized membrane protein
MPTRHAEKENNTHIKNRLPMICAFTVLAVLAILVVLMNINAPEAYTMYNTDTITYEKGIVTAIVDERLEPTEDMPGRALGVQTITARLNSGAGKGREITFDNNLSATHNVRVTEGQSVIIKADCPVGIAPFYSLYSYDRAPGLAVVAAIFIALMLLVGRVKGLRSVLGLGISLFFIAALLVPAIYRGWSPVWMSVLTVIIISASSLILLNGFSGKTLIAVASTVAGAVVSAAFFFVISAALYLTGYDISEAEELILISRNTGLKIGQVLFAGVLIASLGAVMDTTISMAASLYEIKEALPEISSQGLFKSGMAVGRDIIGANCQTLILAFVGSSFATLLVLISYGTRFDQFLSSAYLAIEVIHGITGSIAVILAVPITAALCALPGGKPEPPGKRTEGAAPAAKRRKTARNQRRSIEEFLFEEVSSTESLYKRGR